MKRAQQRLYFLRKLQQASLPPSILTTFCRGAVESGLTYSISTWFSSCSAADKKALQRVVRSAEKVIGASLPSAQEIFLSRCRKRAQKIVRDPSHPLNSFCQLLPSKKHYGSMSCSTGRLLNSFLPQAVRGLRLSGGSGCQGAQHTTVLHLLTGLTGLAHITLNHFESVALYLFIRAL